MNICAVDNIVRWRAQGEGGLELDELDYQQTIEKYEKQEFESNSRIIEWSDGSISLAIGDELFDIR